MRIHRLLIFIFLLVLNSIQLFGQNKTKVLILGTYHMAGTIDINKVENDDILGAKRQKEIKDILNQLEKFKPSKIFVEQTPEAQPYWDSIYVNLQKNIMPIDEWTKKNEIFQLGLQLSNKLKLKKGVFCVDWQMPDSTKNDPLDKIYFKYAKGNGDFFQASPKSEQFEIYSDLAKKTQNEFAEFNLEIPKLNLKDVLLRYNSVEMQRKLYYGNLLILMDENPLKMGAIIGNQGMFRNMNIYSNIIQQTEKSDKNILIIYGAGHGEALRTMLQSHPRFEVIELNKILK